MNFNFAAVAHLSARIRASKHLILRDRLMSQKKAEKPVHQACHKRKEPELVAIWYVNASSGRIECRWTSDPQEVSTWRKTSRFHRFGFVLAAAQQNRLGRTTH